MFGSLGKDYVVNVIDDTHVYIFRELRGYFPSVDLLPGITIPLLYYAYGFTGDVVTAPAANGLECGHGDNPQHPTHEATHQLFKSSSTLCATVPSTSMYIHSLFFLFPLYCMVSIYISHLIMFHRPATHLTPFYPRTSSS